MTNRQLMGYHEKRPYGCRFENTQLFYVERSCHYSGVATLRAWIIVSGTLEISANMLPDKSHHPEM